ncbi:MAG TPA: GNAT family N-acetyltransferase [Actinomycetota bacterium]|nr:GNAT family N-acetyltransferase [Actinomycetota bacterium]
MSLAVRPAVPPDCPRLVGLVRELATYEQAADRVLLTEESLAATLFAPDPKVFVHVAELDGDVVGMALWFLTFSTWRACHGIWLEDLIVTTPARGRGAGRALLAHLAGVAEAAGYARVEWSVLDWNDPAIGFYRHLGAEPMDEWTNYRLSGAALAALAAEAGPLQEPVAG